MIWEEGLSEADLCDKHLWVKVMELEEITDEMMVALEKRRTDYVEPMGLSRLWKSKADNPWDKSVLVPYQNLRKLFDGNPYKE